MSAQKKKKAKQRNSLRQLYLNLYVKSLHVVIVNLNYVLLITLWQRGWVSNTSELVLVSQRKEEVCHPTQYKLSQGTLLLATSVPSSTQS